MFPLSIASGSGILSENIPWEKPVNINQGELERGEGKLKSNKQTQSVRPQPLQGYPNSVQEGQVPEAARNLFLTLGANNR